MHNQILNLGESIIKLHKLSSPGWTKIFDNEIDLRTELYAHICADCRSGNTESHDLPVYANSSIDEMLWTACGCEFSVEYPEDF